MQMAQRRQVHDALQAPILITYAVTRAARPIGACDCAAGRCAAVPSRMPQLCICAVRTEACSLQPAIRRVQASFGRMRLCTVANVTDAAWHVCVQPQRVSQCHAACS
jgi:hypothetical protein